MTVTPRIRYDGRRLRMITDNYSRFSYQL